MRQKDILPSYDGEDKQEAPGDHKKDQKGQGKAEDQGEGGVNISQPHRGNIPEKEDEKEENGTGKDQQSNENSLLRLNLQHYPLVNPTAKLGVFFG